MNVLGIACSPRQKSNSTMLLKEALDELKELKFNTRIIHLRKIQYSSCIGCETCSRTGECIFKDEVTELFQEIDKIDKLIIAAPVYFSSLNANAKGMIDRAQRYWAHKYVLKTDSGTKTRDGFFISTAGLGKPEMHDCSIKIIKNFFHVMNINYKKEFLVNKIDAPGEILSRPDLLEEVREACRKFVE